MSRKRQKPTPVTHPRSRNRPQRHACPFTGCNKRFCFPKDLRRHQETHKGSEYRECAVCQICRRSFSRTDNLARHMSKIHQRNPGTRAMPPDARRSPDGTDSAVQSGEPIGQAAPTSSWRLETGALNGCNTPSADGLVRNIPTIPLPDSPVSDGPGDSRTSYHTSKWPPAEHKIANTLPYLQTAPPSDESEQDGEHRPYPSHPLLYPHQPCTDFESDASDSVHNYESEDDIGFDSEACSFDSEACSCPPGECPEESCQPAQLPRRSGSTSKGARPTAGSSHLQGKGPASRSTKGSKASASGSGNASRSADNDGDGNESDDGGSGEKQRGPRKRKPGRIRKLWKYRCPVAAYCVYLREGIACWSCCMCVGRDHISQLV